MLVPLLAKQSINSGVLPHRVVLLRLLDGPDAPEESSNLACVRASIRTRARTRNARVAILRGQAYMLKT